MALDLDMGLQGTWGRLKNWLAMHYMNHVIIPVQEAAKTRCRSQFPHQLWTVVKAAEQDRAGMQIFAGLWLA